MRIQSGRNWGNQEGQSMVEFALTAVIFFTMIFGVIDLGRAVLEYNLLSSSARDGARAAIVQRYTDDQVKAWTVQESSGLLTTDDVTISGSRTCNTVPCPTVTITVQHTFTPFTPLIGNLIGGSITMTASSTMVVER